jgi:heme exporter protein CcmD
MTMDHQFYLWMSYGVAALAIVVEAALLLARRARAMRTVEEERDLETQD